METVWLRILQAKLQELMVFIPLHVARVIKLEDGNKYKEGLAYTESKEKQRRRTGEDRTAHRQRRKNRRIWANTDES